MGLPHSLLYRTNRGITANDQEHLQASLTLRSEAARATDVRSVDHAGDSWQSGLVSAQSLQRREEDEQKLHEESTRYDPRGYLSLFVYPVSCGPKKHAQDESHANLESVFASEKCFVLLLSTSSFWVGYSGSERASFCLPSRGQCSWHTLSDVLAGHELVGSPLPSLIMRDHKHKTEEYIEC